MSSKGANFFGYWEQRQWRTLKAEKISAWRSRNILLSGGGMEKPEMNLNIRNWDLQAELVSMPFGKGHNTCIYKRQVTEPENWFEVFEHVITAFQIYEMLKDWFIGR